MSRISGSSFGNVVRYCRKSVDGWDSELWCVDGQLHVELLEDPGFGSTAKVLKACDGTCRTPSHDLRKLFAELPSRGGAADPVSMDDGFRRLLDGSGALVGVRFVDGYCKRDSDWGYYCLDRQVHVRFSTSFEWAHDPEKGLSHEVSAGPCDGSCTASVRPDRRAIRQILRDLAHAERSGRTA